MPDRNPILVSYVAKGLLPYHGLGSGIPRALEDWPRIEFTDDRDACLFTATVHRSEATRPPESSGKSSEKGSEKSSEKIIRAIKRNPTVSAQELAGMIGITSRAVEKHLSKLKEKGVISRMGPDKGGHWEVHSND